MSVFVHLAVQEGDRIAQLIIEKIATPDVVAVDVSRLPFSAISHVCRCSPFFLFFSFLCRRLYYHGNHKSFRCSCITQYTISVQYFGTTPNRLQVDVWFRGPHGRMLFRRQVALQSCPVIAVQARASLFRWSPAERSMADSVLRV